MKKRIDCFEQRYGNLFGKNAKVNINSGEGDRVLFGVACLLNCNVWKNSGQTEEEDCDRQLKLLRNMISPYGVMEILASITEYEIVESYLTIVRYELKYFNLTSTVVYEFLAEIFGLKDDNPQWNPAFIIEVCMCAPISNASLERLFNQMNIIKSNVRSRLTNLALNELLRIKVSKVHVDSFHKIRFQGVLNTDLKNKAGK